MKTYFVATLARYVLVDARDENHARESGQAALQAMYDDPREGMGPNAVVNILTVRPATDSEIDLWQFHQRMIAENGGAA